MQGQLFVQLGTASAGPQGFWEGTAEHLVQA